VAVTAPGAAAIAGTVTFRSGASAIAGCVDVAVDGAGEVSCTTSALARAVHDVTATYSGATDTEASTSDPLVQHVDRATVAVALTVSAGPTDVGDPVTLSAQVTAVAPGAGTPAGTVTFRSGSEVLATRSLGPAGAAALVTTALAPGLHELEVDYAVAASFAAGTSAPVAHRVRYPTTVVLASSANPALPGRAVALRATVSSAAGAPDAGSVTFFLDGEPAGPPVVLDGDGGATAPALVPPEPGANVTATYSGSALYAAGGPGRLRQRVAPGRTTVVLTATPSPSAFGAPVTLTARVLSPAGTPDGTVTFRRGTGVLGTAPVDADGVAVLTVPGPVLGAVGAKSILAHYSGSASFRSSRDTLLHDVVAVPTELTLVASANPSPHGAAVTFSAAVSVPPPGAGTPVGTVTFRRGRTALGTVRLDDAGRARLVVAGGALGAPGVKSIQAVYSGSAAFTPATRAVLHVVAP
jgi:hypothetical protein